MADRPHHVCPAALAGLLDSPVRRWFQNPRRLLEPYLREGMTALDFGCGPGFFTLDLARLVGPAGRVLAVDLQPDMLERVRAKLRGTGLESRVVLHRCREDRIGLTEPVDFVFAFYVIHELPDPVAFLTEIRGLLTPGGRLLIVEPPLHVSAAAFEATLQTASGAGFKVAARPPLLFNKVALLEAG